MCNLYSVTKRHSAICDLFAVTHDRTGNLPPIPAIVPDQMAPIVRIGADGERELVTARWGMPGPPHLAGQPVRNIRNVRSPHWRRWLGKGSRCIVPATSFCEYADTKPRKTPIWFALAEDRPLFAFAGLWIPCCGMRGPKSAPVEGDHDLFGFLTTEANAIVALAVPVLVMAASFFMLNRGLGLHKSAPFAAAPDSPIARPSKDNVLVGQAGAGSPRAAGPTGVETLRSVERPASIGSALPPAGGPAGADPEVSTGGIVQAPKAEPPLSGGPNPGLTSHWRHKPGPAATADAAGSEEPPPPGAPNPASVSTAAESDKGPTSRGPVDLGPTATAETAGSREPPPLARQIRHQSLPLRSRTKV
jgi:putative SOS response-associated peptidase YedK